MTAPVDVAQLLEDLRDPNPCRFDQHGHCHEHVWLPWRGPCPQERIRQALSEPHVVEFGEQTWSLNHPVTCRRRPLQQCPVLHAVRVDTEDGPPVAPGTYVVEFKNGLPFYVREDGGAPRG